MFHEARVGYKVFVLVLCVPGTLRLLFELLPRPGEIEIQLVQEFITNLDHFSSSDGRTLRIRYTLVTDYANNNDHGESARDKPLLLLYVGNEDSLQKNMQDIGFLNELAKNLSAYLVYTEHRYYGNSLPEDEDLSMDFTYLSVAQALEDYVQLLHNLNTFNASVIAIGNFYGGILAAALRIEKPELVLGAVSSSAPIAQLLGDVPCDRITMRTSQVFANVSEQCAEHIRRSWAMIDAYRHRSNGSDELKRALQLCEPTPNHVDEFNALRTFLEMIYTKLAMANYPYSARYFGPLPAWPVKAFCAALDTHYGNTNDTLWSLGQAISLYTNATGNDGCNDYLQRSARSGTNRQATEYQYCRDLLMPRCVLTNETIFELDAWNEAAEHQRCQKKHGVQPSVSRLKATFDSDRLKRASNIIFTNGELDPYGAGGIQRSPNDNITVINIRNGAHASEMRYSHDEDPEDVRHARITIAETIINWLN